MRWQEAEEMAIKNALGLQNLKLETLADAPKVVRVEYSLGEDQGGDPSIFIMVYLDDATPESAWTSEKLEPIRERLQNALNEADIDRWLYVRYVTEADLREAAEEDAA